MKIDSKFFSFFLFTVVVLFMVCSCNKKTVKIPEGILTKQELIPVLVDIHLAQAVVGINQFSDTARYNVNEYALAVFKMHHITKAKYDSSLSFYATYPDLLDEIYQEVINELSKKQSEVSAK